MGWSGRDASKLERPQSPLAAPFRAEPGEEGPEAPPEGRGEGRMDQDPALLRNAEPLRGGDALQPNTPRTAQSRLLHCEHKSRRQTLGGTTERFL